MVCMRTKVVCGATNNPLGDETRDSQALLDAGIVYVPDFLSNRLGIVQCANEQYGHLPKDQSVERHLGSTWVNSIYLTTQRVLSRGRDENTTTVVAANVLADELLEQDHPLIGERATEIIQSLVHDHWDREPTEYL